MALETMVGQPGLDKNFTAARWRAVNSTE